MKKIIYIFVALLMVGCSEHEVYNGIVDAQSMMSETSNTDQYSVVLEKARWGNTNPDVSIPDSVAIEIDDIDTDCVVVSE